MSDIRLSALWYQGLSSEEERAALKRQILGSHDVLSVLKNIAKNKIIAMETVSTDDYDSPSWAYKQADRCGYNRAWKEIMSLLQHVDN